MRLKLGQVQYRLVFEGLDDGQNLGEAVRHVCDDTFLVAYQIVLVGLDREQEALEFEALLDIW